MNDTPTSKLQSALMRLGFSQYEAKAYTALVGQSPMNGSEVSKRAGMPPSKVYETLARLETKGAVVVNRSEPVLYGAVPHHDLLTGLAARFEADVAAAIDELDAMPAADRAGLVWSLYTRESILDAFVRLVDTAHSQLFAGIWDEELDALGPALERAAQRGVQTHVAIYGPRTLHGPKVYDLSKCGASARLRLSGRRLAVAVADDVDTVVAEFGDRSPAEAVLTTNPVTGLLAVEYIKADISGRLLINAMPDANYRQLLETHDMQAILATTP
ncbi:TrmB family transcriptional regulator [Rhodococcus sp. 14-2483-1-2]|uniref:TrmB family transcriptional regulator n=1 Tax=Rhodococcus sp. 14-2483-1-2 TaxID=2023147 RepID=UPI001BAFD478|nr:TrmB family transcriptional regulator [Rhodococcus sp. 14-2483-1-2]